MKIGNTYSLKKIPPFVSRKCCIMKEKWRKPRSIDVFTSFESEKWSLKPYIIINISWVVKFMREEESYYGKWKLYMINRYKRQKNRNIIKCKIRVPFESVQKALTQHWFSNQAWFWGSWISLHYLTTCNKSSSDNKTPNKCITMYNLHCLHRYQCNCFPIFFSIICYAM